MRRVIIGTAGHIDHGKTRLVEALTGIDCDRWAEEKRRGITIDIGFAHIDEGDLQLGFVDVPGHEKFLHNALAGLGGIRVMLLVIAADEGVMPQTREHLSVCELLDIPAAVVVLTKSDLVSTDRLATAREEATALLASSRFAEAEILAASSRSGEGIAELRERLGAIGNEYALAPDPRRTTRLPIDRAFLVKGRGLVVTGTLAAGAIDDGAELEVSPTGERARVRGIQVHGEERERAEAGERVALQLAGLGLDAVARGRQLIEPHSLSPANRWVARLNLLPDTPKALTGANSMRLYLFSAAVVARVRPLAHPIEPGGSGLAEIRLASPVAAARADRFILRRPSPAATVGGGVILDPLWRPHRATRLARALELLEKDDAEALRLWVEEAGEGGARAQELAARLGFTLEATTEALARLAEPGKVARVHAGPGHEERWMTGSVFRTVEQRAKRVLRQYFAANRMKQSMSRAEAVAAILPGRGAELASAHLRWLEQQKVLEVHGDKVSLPGRGAELTGGESKLAVQILAAYQAAGLKPPAPSEVRAALGAKAQILDGILSHLREQGKIQLLPGGLLIASTAIEGLRTELEQSEAERLTVGEFKERYDLSRKWAIPLLEHLDSIGATRRIGNERQILRRSKP